MSGILGSGPGFAEHGFVRPGLRQEKRQRGTHGGRDFWRYQCRLVGKRGLAQITLCGPVLAVASGREARTATGSTRLFPLRAWRATDLASWGAVWCVPEIKRTPGPRLTEVRAPAKYMPGIVDSPARFTSGQLPRVVRPVWISFERYVSRDTSIRKPVPAITWSTSMLDRLAPSSWSRTLLPWGSADLSWWPVSTSTTSSTRSRSHHAPFGPKEVSALRTRTDSGSSRNATGESAKEPPHPSHSFDGGRRM